MTAARVRASRAWSDRTSATGIRAQDVAEAAHRLDQRIAVGIELAPQARDEPLDDVRFTAEVVEPHFPQDLALGQDVVGTFIVDGEAETAVGSGQFLKGDSKNATTAAMSSTRRIP